MKGMGWSYIEVGVQVGQGELPRARIITLVTINITASKAVIDRRHIKYSHFSSRKIPRISRNDHS